ncbi:glycosyltransferase [Helicobacter sp. T3_23-1059]
MPNIPIFLSSDNNYAPFVATTIASICDNTKSFCEFYILDGGITQENQAKICELKKQFSNFEIEFIRIDVEKEFKDIEYQNASQYVTISTYNRLLIPNLKPNIDKCIYLDVDIIVCGDIATLYNESLDDYMIGAVWEVYGENSFNIDRRRYLQLTETHKYFNAGVLLINIKKWRENNVSNLILQNVIENKDRIQMADQDVLNLFFNNNQYKELPIKYNFLNKYFMEIKIDSEELIICHFVGNYKPWQIATNYEIEHLMPNHKLFWHYATMTPFYQYLICHTLNENESKKLLRHIHIFRIKRSRNKLNSIKMDFGYYKNRQTFENLEKNVQHHLSKEERHNIIRNFLIKNRKTEQEEQSILVDKYLDTLYEKRAKNPCNINELKEVLIKILIETQPKYHLQKLLNNSNFLWGIKDLKGILAKIHNQKDLYIVETSFLHCIVNVASSFSKFHQEYITGIGYIVDDLTAYYDSTRLSRMELVLNSDFKIDDLQIKRARKIIKKIIDNKITKYNNQPIYKPKFGRDGVKKVLVIDQSYADYSIIKGGADYDTFKLMLDTAIKENPNADILIKTHPDTLSEKSLRPQCYYQNIQTKDNIYRITDMINPISMIEYVDKVYVCTSQFGFEALMCGKEVHTFGLPFYANWGLTIDNQKLARRTQKRTLEEVFYIAYIMFSCYYNFKTNKPCEIEEVIDLLIETRESYFESLKK